MKTFLSPAKRKKKKNIETHDFSTPTEWNVEMVHDKVIVTLSGEVQRKSTSTRLRLLGMTTVEGVETIV